MSKKIFFSSVFLILNTIVLFSQEPLTKKEALSLKESILKIAKQTTTISNDFVQSKHLSFLSKDIISKGKLTYKSPNLIKWEYKTPFKYSVIFKEDKLFINDDGTKSNIDLSANKGFKELNNLIIKSVKGDMFDATKFKITYFKNKENYLVRFVSIDESLKAFIRKFELTFDTKKYYVLEIKMIEEEEDYTTIKFTNQKINKPISDALFNN